MSLLHGNYTGKIQKIIDEYLGVIGLQAVSLVGKGEGFSVNQTETFPTASIIKIPLLMEYYRKSEAGNLNPTEKIVLPLEYICGGSGALQHLTPGTTTLTLEDYATLMIVLSDNVATNILYDKVGNDDVNILLDTLDLKKTKLARKMQAYRDIASENENITSPEDMTNLLAILYKVEGVSKYVSTKTLDKLKLRKEGMIRDAVPEGIEIADKSGWMGGVHCNTGIVYGPKNTYAVTIMFKHVPKSDEKGLETWMTARKILSLIHEYYDEVGSATKYGIRM
jgi:beta-lactamase class A